jgi:hypothetical protein
MALASSTRVLQRLRSSNSTCVRLKNPLPKFPRVTRASHAVLLIGQQHDIPIIRLHQIRATLVC